MQNPHGALWDYSVRGHHPRMLVLCLGCALASQPLLHGTSHVVPGVGATRSLLGQKLGWHRMCDTTCCRSGEFVACEGQRNAPRMRREGCHCRRRCDSSLSLDALGSRRTKAHLCSHLVLYSQTKLNTSSPHYGRFSSVLLLPCMQLISMGRIGHFIS